MKVTLIALAAVTLASMNTFASTFSDIHKTSTIKQEISFSGTKNFFVYNFKESSRKITDLDKENSTVELNNGANIQVDSFNKKMMPELSLNGVSLGYVTQLSQLGHTRYVNLSNVQIIALMGTTNTEAISGRCVITPDSMDCELIGTISE